MFGFSMSKEQKMIKEEVAKLVKDIVIDNAHDMDEAGEIPRDAIQKAWSIGASVSKVPEEYGGYGMKDSPVETAIILEELAYGDMAFAVAACLPSLFIFPVTEMGTADQKKKYLPLYCTETYTPCTLAVNEPHFGFDAVDLKTTAEKKNGSYVLNGSKCLVPMAGESSHMLVAANLDGKNGENGLFIVDGKNPGITVSEPEKNIGLYALNTGEVALNQCEIPAEDRLGGDQGCDYDKLIQKTRTAMAAIGTGVSRASYEFAKDYAKDRVQFGEPITHRQTIAFMIAEMAYEVESMRLLTWKAAAALEAGKDAKREAFLAKIYAGDMTMKITDYGVQILGGHGYVREYPVERYYRNGRGIAVLEGLAIV
jgi:acyl-CoA dehydrogenase